MSARRATRAAIARAIAGVSAACLAIAFAAISSGAASAEAVTSERVAFPDDFSGRAAWRADSVLASPAFEGRRTGSRGGAAAEDWIAAQFAASGLLPGMPDGSWFLPFSVIGSEPRSASMEILDGPFGRVPLVYGDDFTLMLDPAAGKVTAEAVFVGYGIDAPAKGRNDYTGCDLEGKIAVILRGRPDDGQDWDREFMRTHTFAAARAHGAAAVLFYQAPYPVNGAALAPEVYDAHTPAGYVGDRAVRILLRETGYTLEDVQEKLKKGPFPLESGKRIRFESAVRGPATATARDVVGALRGSDPAVGSEVVVIGAHHDHLGLDAAGRLFAGASDNASGTAVVLEIARAAHAAGWRPRRTVLFTTFSGEEYGLLGSRAFAAHMPVDSTRVVAMLNLDMVGLGDGGIGIAGGATVGPAYFRWRAGLDSTRAAAIDEGQAGGEHSDYAPFMQQGIPVLSFWSRGQHGRYHDFEDLPRYLQPGVMDSVGRGIASLLGAIADAPEAMADGFGHERILRTGALQIDFQPVGANDAASAGRAGLSCDYRIAGRIALCDPCAANPDETIRHLGDLLASAPRRLWVRLVTDFKAAAEANDGLRTALIPVVRTSSLDRYGPSIAGGLCAAGLGPPLWAPKDSIPSAATCGVLAREKRPVIAETSAVPWKRLIAREPDLRLLLLWDREAARLLPEPPDSTARSRVLLVVPVGADDDSSFANAAVRTWGEKNVHFDMSGLLGVGAPDSGSLRFIRGLRQAGWPDPKIEAVLGKNLGGF